jgi:hypothetical protein
VNIVASFSCSVEAGGGPVLTNRVGAEGRGLLGGDPLLIVASFWRLLVNERWFILVAATRRSSTTFLSRTSDGGVNSTCYSIQRVPKEVTRTSIRKSA